MKHKLVYSVATVFVQLSLAACTWWLSTVLLAGYKQGNRFALIALLLFVASGVTLSIMSLVAFWHSYKPESDLARPLTLNEGPRLAEPSSRFRRPRTVFWLVGWLTIIGGGLWLLFCAL